MRFCMKETGVKHTGGQSPRQCRYRAQDSRLRHDSTLQRRGSVKTEVLRSDRMRAKYKRTRVCIGVLLRDLPLSVVRWRAACPPHEPAPLEPTIPALLQWMTGPGLIPVGSASTNKIQRVRLRVSTAGCSAQSRLIWSHLSASPRG